MSYDLENLKKNRGGATLEVPEKEVSPAGLYKHPDSGEELITKDHPLFGNAQSEGAVRAGFEYVRAVDTSEVKSIVEQVLESKVAASDDLRGLSARLRELEDTKKVNEAERNELEQLRAEKAHREAQPEVTQSADLAKEAGADKAETLVKTNGPATDAKAGTDVAGEVKVDAKKKESK